MNNEITYPPEAEKLYWGAAILTPIWAISHKKYIIAVLSLIPFIGFIVSLLSLIYGGRWAWDNIEWESELYFKESRLKWNIGGFVVFFTLWIILFFIVAQ